MEIEVQSKLNAERDQIRKQAREQAEQQSSIQVQEQAQQLADLQSALKTAQQNEMDLRRKEREAGAAESRTSVGSGPDNGGGAFENS